MNNLVDREFRAVLTAIDTITQDPPALPATAPTVRSHRFSPLFATAGTFVVVLLVIGAAMLATRMGSDPVTGTGQSIPHYVVDLPGWDPVQINDDGTSTAAIFWNHTDLSVLLLVVADGRDAPAGTAYRRILADRETPFGTADVVGTTAQVFEIPDSSGFELIWQSSGTSAAQLTVYNGNHDTAVAILSGIRRVSNDDWSRLVAQFPPVDPATTTTYPAPTTTHP